jgi:hypothetical protein
VLVATNLTFVASQHSVKEGSKPPFAAKATKVRNGVGFSDATGAAFELRVALPGVGEALKREIVGLVWVDRLLLWGFAQCVCFRPELTGQFGGAH